MTIDDRGNGCASPEEGLEASPASQPKVSKLPSIVLLVVAVLLMVYAFTIVGGGVSCGSQTMTRGDKCVSTSSGKSQTYEEVQESTRNRAIAFGAAGVLVAGAAITIGLVRRPKRSQQR